MDPASGSFDTSGVMGAARSFLRPIDWRKDGPTPEQLEGCLLFERDRTATSFDGTRIAYGVHGRRGPWIALVPGFCCPDNFWRYLLPALATDHRVIVWDLRGLGLSGMPRPPGYRSRNLTWRDFAIPTLARDLEAVLDDAGVRRAALIGHSMGGQTILETYARMPERVSSLVFLTAPFESPIRTFYGRDIDRLYRLTNYAVRSMPRPAVLLWRALLLANPALSNRLAQLVHALGPDTKVEDMAPYYRHLAYLDPLVVLKMAEAMHQHSAGQVLAQVRVPALILSGTNDTFTPPNLAEAMAEAIPNAETAIVRGATHGAVIEKPNQVNAAVRSFLARRDAVVRRGADGGAAPHR